MNSLFREGFEKVAKKIPKQAIKALSKAKGPGGAALALGAAGLLGMGAMAGHASHINKKILHAINEEDYKPKTLTEKHPKTMGALTLGMAPAFSTLRTRRQQFLKNPRLRKVLEEHPYMTAV